MTDKAMIVSDNEADRSLESLVVGRLVPATGFGRSQETEQPTKTGARDSKKPTVSAAELRLLRAIMDYPLRPSSEYPKLARISPNTFQKLREAFVSRGLIKERKLESSGRGRSTLMLEPLDTAKELLSACGENGS